MAKSPLAKAGGTKNAGVICGLRRSPGKGMTTHSIILAWRILFTEEPGGYSPWGCKESDTTEHRQTLSGYKYFEVTHSIFRLFMTPVLWSFIYGHLCVVSFILFPFKSVSSVSETVWRGSHFSNHLGTIQTSFPSVSEHRFGLALFLSFFLIYSQGQGMGKSIYKFII